MERLFILFIGIIIGILAFPFLGSGSNLEAPFGGTYEKSSPSDWITEDQIKVGRNEVTIDLKGATISRYADTNSMDPVLDENSNGIEIPARKPSQIQEGDIITYKMDQELIVHRVKEIGNDKKGWYCIPKGDNNRSSDDKIRFEDIEYITVGILY